VAAAVLVGTTGTAALAVRPSPPDPLPPAHAHGHHSAALQAAARHTVPNELLRTTLAEEGSDEAGDNPSLSALCQSFLGHPTPYHAVAPDVDEINHDSVVTVGSQTGCSTAQNETTIAVNTLNPRSIVAGANDYRLFNSREARNDSYSFAYTSRDGGATWADIAVPKLTFQTNAPAPLSYMDGAGDPAVAFGPGNTVYYASLVFSRAATPPEEQAASGIVVNVSHDAGLTWGDPVIIQLDGVRPDGTPTPTPFFNDKEWITADPLTGTVYVTWTRFTFDAAGNFLESPIVSARSSDFGRTFSAPTRVAPSLTGFTGGITPFDQGSNPQIGLGGVLYVAYEASVCATAACDQPADHDAVVVARSTDRGRTFSNTEVALDFDFPPNEDAGSSTLTGENFRINSFPQMAIDRLTNQLWITWADDRHGSYAADGTSIKTNGDALLTGSLDGRHWSTPRTLGTAADEVFSAVAAFGTRVAVSYYPRVYDPAGVGLDYAYQVGWLDQLAGTPVRRITTQTSDPRVQFVGTGQVSGEVLQGLFIGDYSAMAIGADFQLHPSWTDFRGNPGVTLPNQDAMTRSISALP